MSLSEIDNDLAMKIDNFAVKHNNFQKNTGRILQNNYGTNNFENVHPNQHELYKDEKFIERENAFVAKKEIQRTFYGKKFDLRDKPNVDPIIKSVKKNTAKKEIKSLKNVRST